MKTKLDIIFGAKKDSSLDSVIKDAVNGTRKLSNASQLVTRQSKALHTVHSQNNALLSNQRSMVAQLIKQKRVYEKAQKSGAVATEKEKKEFVDLQAALTKANSKLATLTTKTSNSANRIKRFNSEVHKTNKGLKSTNQSLTLTSSLFDKLKSAKGVLAGAGLIGGGLGIKHLVGKSMSLERAMSFNQATLGITNKNDSRIKDLYATADRLGANTEFNATEVAQAMLPLAQAGYSPEKIKDTIGTSLNLALVSKLDPNQTADIATNVMAGFDLKSKDADKVGDILWAATSKFKTNIEGIGETMKYSAVSANQLGLSLQETSTMAGLLGSAGLDGSTAGTSLNAMLSELSKTDEQEKLESLGVSVQNNDGTLRNFADILADYNQATSDMGDVDKNAKLIEIFGKQGARAFGVLTKAVDAGKYEDGLKAIQKSNGSLQKSADIINNNTVGAFKNLSSAFDGLMNELLAPALAPLTSMVKGLTSGLSWLKESISGTNIGLKALAIGGIAGLTVGIGLLTVKMTKFGLGFLRSKKDPISQALKTGRALPVYVTNQSSDILTGGKSRRGRRKKGLFNKLKSVGSRSSSLLKRATGKVPLVGALLATSDIISVATNKNATNSDLGATVGGAGGSLTGAMAGGAAGAAIGSIVPLVGTAIGGAVGSITGAIVGSSLGESIGSWFGSWFDSAPAKELPKVKKPQTTQLIDQSNIHFNIKSDNPKEVAQEVKKFLDSLDKQKRFRKMNSYYMGELA